MIVENEDREILEKCAVEIRELIFDDADDIVQSAMAASPIEVIGFASEWIKNAKSELDRLKQENETLTYLNNRSVEIIDNKDKKIAELQLKNEELVEALASLDICHAVRRKDKTLFLNVNTTQKTHDLIWSVKSEE